MSSFDYDFIVIGAGAVGLATAAELSARGRVLVIEAQSKRGMGTSSRNSEVVHAGIYYPPGSLKAQLCVAGGKLIEELAAAGRIQYRKAGKLIVAVDEQEVKSLNDLYENARRSGAEGLQQLDKHEVHKLEPEVRAVAGVYSTATGILSAHSLMNYFHTTAKQQNADFVYSSPVRAIRKLDGGFVVAAGNPAPDEATSRFVVNCAGLYADAVARAAGLDVEKLGLEQVWAKGYYYRADGLRNSVIHRLVYPVPSRPIVSLGVHATIDLGGGIKFGPTSFYLEAKVEDYSLPKECPKEVKADIARYLPAIRDYELEPVMAGIRAKLQRAGQAHRDFSILECTAYGLPGFVNLCGIESPGLTASPAIAQYVGELLKAKDEG